MIETKDLIGDQCYKNYGKKLGRPSKLSIELIEEICELIRAGNYIEVAVGAVGVSKDSFYRWMKEGKKSDDATDLRKIFSDSIIEAEHQAIVKMNAQMERFEKSSWKPLAWRLERRFGNKYGKHETLEVVQNPLEGLNEVLEKSVKNLEKKDQVEDPTDEVDESDE